MHKPRGRSHKSVPAEVTIKDDQKRILEIDEPKGISISSAMPSMPMKVKAITVTKGIVLHPRSLTIVNGRIKR
jgi:hypothetical protein